jgi:uncharacterized protein (DUF488 family)
MCSEADQKFCHRRFIVNEIERRGFTVKVIGKNNYDLIEKINENNNVISINKSNIKLTQALLDGNCMRLYTIGFTKKTLSQFL